MDVENGHAPAPAENGAGAAAEPPAEPLPEVEAYAYLLALMHLLDRRRPAEVRSAATHIWRPAWLAVSLGTAQPLQTQTGRHAFCKADSARAPRVGLLMTIVGRCLSQSLFICVRSEECAQLKHPFIWMTLLSTRVEIDFPTLPQAKAVADAALAFLAGFNRRTLDMIASRIYFYFSLTHERLDSLASIRRLDFSVTVRPGTQLNVAATDGPTSVLFQT